MGSGVIRSISRSLRGFATIMLASALAACGGTAGEQDEDWAGYGRDLTQQHYSPLAKIDAKTVGTLGLAWSMDLGDSGNTATQPIAVDGILYFAKALSVVHAVDAVTGKLLWSYDPEVGERAGLNLRVGWGVRGVAWWDGKIYTGTQDGRLIALDAKTGKQVWSVQTFPPENAAYISGAPRVFDGKVLIGFGSSAGFNRGYVTAYDAASGKQVWRFYTVPGDPSKPFEDEAMAMAAKTWSGEWWKYGGGADVWNAIAYDAETDTVFIGTGSPYPWNHRVRSAGKGDNLFICSIVALSGKTGKYKWHYQTVPGDTWDFDAAMDIELADLEIDGQPRKVIIQAPKNGFFYVIDRITGKLISAQPFAKTTWASKIDIKTGRPVEVPGARYPDGKAAEIWPTSLGAHNWIPMAYSPKTGIAYIPAVENGFMYSDGPADWKVPTDRNTGGMLTVMPIMPAGGQPPAPARGRLIAWSVAQQKPVWAVEHATYVNGGVLATGGNLVFQGTIDGQFKAYDAGTGKQMWAFDARAPIMATPITYSVNGQQYVTVLTGLGMAYPNNLALLVGAHAEKFGIDPRSQPRRVLTFAIGGKATLPPRPAPAPPPEDPDYAPDQAAAGRGAMTYAVYCSMCHGGVVVGSGHAPDLRRSPIPVQEEAFMTVVRDGVLRPRGMPDFPEMGTERLNEVRQYIRSRADELRKAPGAKDRNQAGIFLR